MKVILREDVYKLGKSGDLITVRDGYARNYLLPRNLAMLANEANVRQLAHEKAVIELHQQKLKGAAVELGKKFEGAAVVIKRKVGEQDKLYGSVTALDVAEALAGTGLKVERRTIHLPEPIRATGTFEVELRLHRDVTAKVQVTVEAEPT